MSSSIYQEMRRADKELCRQGNRMRLNAERQAEKEAERKVPTIRIRCCMWVVRATPHAPRRAPHDRATLCSSCVSRVSR